MEWIIFEEKLPEESQFILTIRHTYPSHYWVGYWNSDQLNAEHRDEYWMPLPDRPN